MHLLFDKVLLCSGIQNEFEGECLVSLQEDSIERRTRSQGVEGKTLQDPSGY
jgi:hypothetical protein